MGVANGFKSVKLKHVSINLMYNDCDKELIRTSRSLVILIPSNQLAGPKSVNEYFCFNLFL